MTAIPGSPTSGSAPERTVTGTAAPPNSVPTLMGPSSSVEVPLVADPAPLGLAAFGLTTLVLSVINAGWIGAAAIPAVLSMALPYGGVAQLLAGMWAFRRGNTFAATAFSSFGAFWITFYFFAPQLAAIKPATTEHAILGTYLIAWGIFTAYMFIASLGGTRAVQSVFILLTATYVLLAVGAWAGQDFGVGWTMIGGYLGLATAVAALYTSFADVLNANFKRTILPTN